MVLWGMGLPLGLAVWASWGSWPTSCYRKRNVAHLLPWVWMTFTFFYQSIQFVKTVRYLLPIYPTMALMAGYGLMRLWEWARSGRASSWRSTLASLARKCGAVRRSRGLVVSGHRALGLAFTSIYTRPVTRIAASRWMYPEHPARRDASPSRCGMIRAAQRGRAQRQHRFSPASRWSRTGRISPRSANSSTAGSSETEYIALSSNRLYGSIPRLPTRYPMTTRYYEALFSGELGYDELITFTSRPRLVRHRDQR